MSPRRTWTRRPAAVAAALTVLLGTGACSSSDDGAALGATSAANSTTSEGCPVTVQQISAAFGVPAQGGDTTVNSGRLACTFYLTVNGRPVVLNGVTLPSKLTRLENLTARAGGRVRPAPNIGPGAFTYTRQDPTSETGLAYTALATYEDAGGKDVRWTYKFSVLLPSVDRAYDLEPLLTKLTSMVTALPSGHPLARR